MNKDEILEKSRKENENRDLAELEAIYRGSSIAVRVAGTLCVLISDFERLVNGKYNPAVYAVYFCLFGVTFIYKYIKLKKKRELLWGVAWLVISAALLAVYVLETLGVM